MILLVGPGGAGKTTAGDVLARRLGVGFVDLDGQFTTTQGDISEYLDVHGYAAYATQNVQTYSNVIGALAEPLVLVLSSGFMTYANEVHPDYARFRREIAVSPRTLVLLPSLDYETCVVETVRRQLGRSFSRSPEREEQVIRARFSVYRDLPAKKVETMRTLDEVVEAVAANLLPNTALETTPRGAAIITPRGAAQRQR
jgi:shikimate kinase